MLQQNKYKNIRQRTNTVLLLLTMICVTVTVTAQNINSPNKRGPLGTQVNSLTGNLFIKRTDMLIPARAFDLDISFYYNSFNYRGDIGFGNGWSFKYNISYAADTAGGRVIIMGDGREDVYDSISGGGYKAPRGFFSKLLEYQPGKYKLVQLDSTVYFFDNTVHKKITRMQEPNGNFINFNYTDSLLTSIVNAAGQTITFNHNANGKLTSIVDAVASPSRVFTYVYDGAGNLTEAKDPLNGKYSYSYLINGPMKTLTDKNSNTVNIIYFSDLSTSELIGCNKRISFSYDTLSKKTVITDHMADGNNQVTTYTYKKLDRISWITSVTGNCCGYNMMFEYDDNGNQLSMTDGNGNKYQYTYDSNGNALTVKDPLNQVSTYTYSTQYNKITSYRDNKGFLYMLNYDARGNLVQMIAPGNNIYSATYNAAGDIISSTDPKGNTFNYNYDAFGRPVSVTGPNGYNATLSFDNRGNLLAFTDGLGNTLTGEYDILDRLKRITDPVNSKIEFGYDANGNIVTIKNQNAETGSIKYDASNRVVRITGPTGNQQNFSYDAMDNLKSVTNAFGSETKFNYDTRNRLIAVSDADNNTNTYNYDANGNRISASMANGEALNYSYDQLNRLITVKDNTGTLATFTHDNNNNVTSYTSGTGAVTTLAYDSLNRVKQFTDPLGSSKIFTYDKNNNITGVTDFNGHVSSYTYDELNRIKTFTDNNGNVITAGYDINNNVVQLKDQNNNTTNYSYDSLNRRKITTYPDGSFVQLTYDKKGNITAKRQADGTVINYQYDTLNRIVTKTLPANNVYMYTYDALNRVITATNAAGAVFFSYDKLNRITAETFDGRTTNYSYNVSGRTQTIVYPDNVTVIKEFDIRNRLIKILKDSVPVVEYSYDNNDQLIKATYANGISTDMQYDFADRLNNIITAGSNIQNTSFTYDKEKNKTSIIRNNDPSLSEQFTYDNGYRVTNYKRGVIGGSPVIQNAYTYDAAGNRTAAVLNGVNTTYGVNNLNQLTGVNGTGFSFDGRGNLTYDGTFYKKYDGENRLVKDSSSPLNVISYGYDALGRRITKTINGNTLKYTFSGLSQIEERNSSNALLNRTVFADLLTPVLNEKNGNSYYYHQNELKSVEAITNANGRLIESYRYDIFGKPSRYDSLNNPLASSIAGNRFAFTGQEYDSASGSYHFYFRNYSPVTGVFNQRDWIAYEDGMNMYQYVGNNPANGLDIFGLKDCPPKGTDWGFVWTVTSWSKTEIENFVKGLKKEIPYGGFMPLDVLGGVLDSYNALKSGESFANARSGTEKGLYAGDFIKNTTNASIGFGGLISGLMEGTAASVTSTGLGIIGVTLGGLDIESNIISQLTVQASWEDAATQSERDARDNYINQATNMEDRVQRIIKWDQNEMARKERQRKWHEEHDCPENGGTRKPPPGDNDPAHAKVKVLRSYDPNEMIGPEGQPDVKWVSVKDRMPYTILYENDTTANAPAKSVRITTLIEPKEDPATFQLGSFGFNNQTFDIPAATSAYYQRLDCRDSMGLFVDITAGYDQINNEAFWELKSIDPVTLSTPDDPLKGFLFLQDTLQSNNGHGFVNFSIKPRSNAVTRDTVAAKAQIVFDENEVIGTNIYTNTIDAFPPTSHMNAITSTANPVALSWSGTDDTGGCGIDYYTVYISTDQVNYSVFIPHISRTDTTVKLPVDSGYCFFVLATDRVGNKEPLRAVEIKCAYIGGPALPISWLYFNGKTVAKDNILSWATASEQNSKEFRIERSLNGNNFTQIGTVAAAGNAATASTYTYTDQRIDLLNSPVMFYRLKQIDKDDHFRYSNIVRLNYNETGNRPTIVYPNPTQGTINILLGDKNLLGSEAELIDVNGRSLRRILLSASNQSINLDGLANGIYFIRLINKETLRVIKQ